jgi:hypothetical protein
MGSKGIDPHTPSGWASQEFARAHFGDPRLTARLIRVVDRIAELPESPINQACQNWAETKGAYRFFQNDRVVAAEILIPHAQQTVVRARQYQTILAIQDTSYFSYTSHKKTQGLGTISRRPGTHVEMMSSQGIVMHTAFAVTTDGLPLGLLDQQVFARQAQPETLKQLKKTSHNNSVPIEAKESFRWLESLRKTQQVTANSGVHVVTVCDREGDMYELFELAYKDDAALLVRASKDRLINKASRYTAKPEYRLWSYMQGLSSQGDIAVEIPAGAHKPARVAQLALRFGSITLNPPRNHLRHKTEVLPDLDLSAVYLVESDPPATEEPLEWMLLTNLAVTNVEQALEKVRWYCLRWRIEVFHKILKSGLKVEACRLQTADRLMRYLTLMSVIAWRIFWITLISRAHPDLPCSSLLADEEWKVLYAKMHPTKPLPIQPPPLKATLRWIAQLGGFLARKHDREPGPIALWRGWKRLCDLAEGWELARGRPTCG